MAFCRGTGRMTSPGGSHGADAPIARAIQAPASTSSSHPKATSLLNGQNMGSDSGPVRAAPRRLWGHHGDHAWLFNSARALRRSNWLRRGFPSRTEPNGAVNQIAVEKSR